MKYTMHSLRKRILTLIVTISFIFCLLGLRLGIVQIINGKNLQQKAESQWTRNLPLVAERGKIYDTTGSSLAVSYTTYNVYTRARQIKDAVGVAKKLSELLNLDYMTVYDKAIYNSVSEVLIASQIEVDVAEKILDCELEGVFLSENIKRYYPYGDLLTQILGFTTIDNQGQAGIELFYDNYLKGVNGYSLVQSDLRGVELDNTLRSYIPSIPGNNITLTIDSKIQLIVERTLEKLMVEQKAKAVSCIVMNPNNGEVLAMSNKPSFDLNDVPRNDISYLMETVKNKCVIDVYEPGSTFKILTMASTLENKTASLNTGFYCGGSCVVDGEKIKCWKSVGHGSQDLTDGLCNSCNCVFVDLALRLGLDKFYDCLKNYGFGEMTNIEVSGESGGILMNKNNVKNVDLARMGFGQAVAVTPIQLISAISAVVNGGTLYKPQIIKNIKDFNGNVVYDFPTTPKRRVVSKETSDIINMMLEETVSKPGKYTFVPGYEIGGKTGTTQKYENGKISGKYISSFIGTYPASKPEYIVLVIVDEPGSGQYYGSIVASPYAKEIFSGIFEYKNIQPLHGEQANINVKEVEMPNLVGLSLSEAVIKLNELALQYEIMGEGGIIKEQLPPAGTKILNTTTIILTT